MVLEETQRQFRSSVVPRLRRLGRRMRLYTLLEGLALLLPAVLAAILITLLVDRAFWLAWDMRLTQLLTLLLVLAFIAWRWVWRPLRVPLHDADLALLIERRYPTLESRLISAVQFVEPVPAGIPAPRSPALVRRVLAEAQAAVSSLRFQDTLAHPRARKQASVVLGCMATTAVITLGAPETMSLWFQRNVLLLEAAWPQQNRLSVEGLTGDRLIVPRGDDVTITARVDEGYEPPRQVYIQYRTAGGPNERKQMLAVADRARPAEGTIPTSSATRFVYTFERIGETLEHCRVVGGDARTEWFTVEVVDRPRIEKISLAIKPPDYTRSPAYELRPGQTVAEALKGSEVEFRVQANKPLTSASLIRQVNGIEENLGALPPGGSESRDLDAHDAPAATATYHFRMTDRLGFSNISDHSPPVRISVRLIPDRPPGVKMRVRGVGEMITTEAILPIEVDVSDGYGLASTSLIHTLSREDAKPVSEPVAGFEPHTKTFTRTIDWLASRHKLAEGDRLTLQAEATDFDDVSGPNVGESNVVTLRVVSREELLSELNRREQEYRQDFERLTRQQEELYGELLTLSQPSPTPEQERLRQFNLLARRQRDHAGRLNAIRLQFEQVLAELQVNQLSSPTVEARLGGGIVEPMGTVSRLRMPAAADALDALARGESVLADAKVAQDEVLADMNTILANMLKWEGFQEAVTLLREILKMQGNLNQETEKRIEAEIFGTDSTTGPSK